jgi:hypothetical protein
MRLVRMGKRVERGEERKERNAPGQSCRRPKQVLESVQKDGDDGTLLLVAPPTSAERGTNPS